jgi:dTDP-4-amino-4,6-dideoxygalactose transaminase
MELNIKPKDGVITTTYSFFATFGCISLFNVIPVFENIDLGTFNINPVLIGYMITKKTNAFISEHFCGVMVDLDLIFEIAI